MPDPRPARPVTPVGIIADRLAFALELLDDDLEVDADAVAAVRLAHGIAAGLDPYLESCVGPEPSDLARLAEQTRQTDWDAAARGGGGALEQEMLSGHVEARFLQLLVRATRARRVLEIGMFTGYAALAMAQALPSDGTVVALEVDPEAARIAQDAFAGSPAGSRIEVRMGDAAATLHALSDEGQRFDLVFVDADKAGYAGYLDLLLEQGLLAEGGLVCVDNTLMQGQPWTQVGTPNGDAITAFNQQVTADPRVEQVLVPLRDGITLIRRAGAVA